MAVEEDPLREWAEMGRREGGPGIPRDLSLTHCLLWLPVAQSKVTRQPLEDRASPAAQERSAEVKTSDPAVMQVEGYI